MKGNINIRSGFEYFRYPRAPLNVNPLRPDDAIQSWYIACDPDVIYRVSENTANIFDGNSENLARLGNVSVSVFTYPNPVVDGMNLNVENITIQNIDAVSFKFYDALGRIVSGMITQNAIDYSREQLTAQFRINNNLQKGVYTCKAIVEGNIVVAFTFTK